MAAKYPKTASIVQPRPKENAASNKAVRANKVPGDLEARIQERAYQLYERRGRADGFDRQDWIEAEAQIRKELGLS